METKDHSPKGAFETGVHRNLFAEWLGISEDAIQARLEEAWQHYFYGDDETERVYYPDGDSACLMDIANDDARSEGMSYGMMIAVQLDHQAEFDRLWKWTKTHMYHSDGELAGYFAWHCRRNGTRISEGPAPDGEEWFAMALFFAARRWGSGEGIFNYEAEANAILEVMLHKSDEGRENVISMFDRDSRQVRFVPARPWAGVTDPSYHLPAFYELWGRWAARDRDFWLKAAATSRELFRKAAHPATGLMPDYSYFDGAPKMHQGHEDFRYDAWRTLSNVALDHAWFAADPWQVEQSNRVLDFLTQFRDAPAGVFTLDGRVISSSASRGLMAMAAVAGLAADREKAEPFVRRLWEAPLPSGHYRYYDGMLTFFGLLQVGGHFRIHRNHGPDTQ
ncbi:MAG: glycosyl hydrolase family 8 [Opitutaceae bacterium]